MTIQRGTKKKANINISPTTTVAKIEVFIKNNGREDGRQLQLQTKLVLRGEEKKISINQRSS